MDAVSAHARLVDEIRADLLRGHFAPGERLVEIDLAERYEAPRAAVRIALMTLATEGLVERQPNRGASVRALSIEECIEIAEIRRELEGLCARHAAGASSAAERGELLGLVEAMRLATEQGLTAEYRELSVRFHERIAEVADQTTAHRFLREVRNHRLNVHFPEAFAAGTTMHSLEQHAAIARAIAAGDADGAGRLMREHVSHVVALLEDHASRLEAQLLA